MFEPQQQLRKLSLDEDLQQVLRTPNRIKYKNQDFQGWQDRNEHPLESPERKPVFHSSKVKFKVKPSKIKINPQSVIKNPQMILQNKQNRQDEKTFNLKIIKMIEQQTLSPNSRRLLTPNKLKSPEQFSKNSYTKNRLYQTPTSTHRSKETSLHKLSFTEGLTKLSFSQKRHKPPNDQFISTDDFGTDENGYKIPLSAIVYPVLKSSGKKTLRRIQRFHSFVARTVRK